jgi:CBS domain-containing protein
MELSMIQDPTFARIRVAEAMHTGILTTDPTTPLRTVARLMAEQHVHAVAVADPDHAQRPFGFITVAEIAAAVAGDIQETAGQAAATEVVAIPVTAPLDEAARMMIEHGVDHLIVVDTASGHPLGILSGLDLAAAYANA